METVLIDGVRSPFCKAMGPLERVPAQELGAMVLRELIERTDIDRDWIDQVVVGNVACPMDAANVGRVIALRAGLSVATPAHTVSRNCASGMEAAVDAVRRIQAGEASLIAVVGVESMSRLPLVYPDGFRALIARSLRARGVLRKVGVWSALRPRHLAPLSALRVGLTDPVSGLNMGETAEVLAREFSISREAQDRYALRSHQRAIAALAEHAREIAPYFVPPYSEAVTTDVGPRTGQNLAKLSRLPAVFDQRGSVTAGNSSMVSDGAVALLVASRERARELGLSAIARFASHAVAGCDPRRMGLGPVYAAPLALDRAGLRLGDLAAIELNEAFAVQVLACLDAFASRSFAARELGRGSAIGEIDPEILNPAGGAIALGHPVGASGARLLLRLARELAHRGGGFGLATLCVGGGQGQAVVLEAIA